MKDRTINTYICVLAITVSIVIAMRPASGAPYTLLDLGVPPFNSSMLPTAINSSSMVAGYTYNNGTYNSEAFLYENGTLIAIGDLGGGYSDAFDINDLGTVVGSSTVTRGGPRLAYTYTIQSAFTDLGTLPGRTASVATSINSSNQVVGYSYTDSVSDSHAFIYDNGVMTDLGTLPGDTQSAAYGINDVGVVVGLSANAHAAHAFSYAHGVMRDIGNLGMAISSASGVNRRGDIFGESYDSSGMSHTFIYSDGVMRAVGVSFGALGINDPGEMVGSGKGGAGVLWTGGRAINLNNLMGFGRHPHLGAAWDINNSGFIVIEGDHYAQAGHAYIMIPAIYIKTIYPTSTVRGSQGFTMNLRGGGFSASSKVMWNGKLLATTFVSSSEIKASVPASQIATARRDEIEVLDGANTSNPKYFTVTGSP